WTRFGQSSGEPLRTGDLRLGNSEGQDSRTSTALHSEPKASISLETVARPDPRIFHTAPQKHESLGPTGVQDVLFSVAAAAQQLAVCTATVYTLCARGQRPHIRILNGYPHRADGPESLRGCSTCSNARQVTGRGDLPRRFK